jgi:hypothetical protein
MHTLAISLGIAGFVLGLLAAWEWFRASRVNIVPVWGDLEPKDPVASQMGWIAGVLQASAESARLNQRAAALTAVTVVVSTGASLAGLFP